MSDASRLANLLAFIQGQTGATAVEVVDYQSLSGGAIQENKGLDVRLTGGTLPGDHRFVVRSDAAATLSQSLRRWQEYEVLKVAHAAGVQVPTPYWSCRNPQVMGADFYVMQRAAGSANARRLAKADGLTPEQRRSLVFEVGQNLARLHQVPYTADVLPFLAAPDCSPAQQRLDEYRRALDGMPEVYPALELALRVLQDHMPQSRPRVLCHGDFRAGNYMVDHGRLTAILDWEFASWSDPNEDLGWMCARSWRFGHPEREVGGVGDKPDFFAGYQSISGHVVDPVVVAWWELIASVRWAIIAREQAQRHLSGQQPSLELALTGRMLPEIQRDLMMHLRDFVALSGQPPVSLTDRPLTVSNGRQPLADHVDRPHGAELLQVARQTLLDALLPVLPPEQRYNARMAANAMAMACRELESGPSLWGAQQARVQAFCQAHGLAAADLALLVDHIRHGDLVKTSLGPLCTLVDELLELKLALSNPGRTQSA
ncbi:phosphotransferase family protein [Castellaniella sp.]|uniref:phosphotransferase family protein n=1 Tax=Castellaniella sp. TaxID=1955812 RepID=UPI00356425AF